MGTSPTITRWDAQGNPLQAPEQPQGPAITRWDASGNPLPARASSPARVDAGQAFQAAIHSKMLGVDPGFAYQHNDKIKSQLQEVGGDYWSDAGRAAETGVEETPLAMLIRGRAPDPFESHDLLQNFVHDVSSFASDPVFLGAAIGGSFLGGPEVGIPLAFALDAGLRKGLMDHYQKGNVKSFGELTDRAAATLWAGAKGAITGEAAVLAGGLPVPGALAGSVLGRFGVHALYQSAALTTVGSLLDWRVPKMEDFTRTAAVVAGLGLLSLPSEMTRANAQRALMDVYAKDGTPPAEAVAKLQAQPPVIPDMEPGLRPAIQFTRTAGAAFDSTEISTANAATSGKAVMEADEGDGHPELAEKMLGRKPVGLEELERAPTLADRVLAQPDSHLQQVIDRAAELMKEQTGEAIEPPKSGRGFTTPEGKFLNREQAKSWVKKNEPEVYAKWSEITEDEKSEFHSDDYRQARERVQNRTMAEGDPGVAAWSPQLAKFVAGRRPELNDIKAGVQSSKYGKAVLIDLFVGPRNMLRAAAEQLRTRLAKLIPDFRDQEALTFFRDYKGSPDELRAAIEEVRAGKNEKLKAYIPSMERALSPSPELLQADQQMTEYFTNALGLGRQVGILESSIDPERYSPRLFTKALEDEEEARREGRPRFTARTPHAIRREYLRILDPLKSGEFEARTFNALDELSVYGDRHATAVATSIFKTELKNTELGKNGSRSDVPADWRELPGTHKSIITKDARTGETKSIQQGFYVPQVVSDAMRPILEQNVLSGVASFKAVRAMQSYIKSMELGLSVFHMKALSLMAWSNMKLTDFVKALRSDNSSPEFEEGEREAALWGTETTMTGPAYEAYKGLKPSSLPTRLDTMRGIVGVKQLDAAAQALTHETFDVIQRKFKVMDFSLKRSAWLAKHLDATDAEYGAAMRSIAKEVNAVYGGLNWEIMGWGPNARELARAFMLAPDWTFSNFANLKYIGERGPGGAAARAFWLKSTATGLTMTAAASLAFTGQLSKHPTEVYLGKDKQGKEVYSNIFFAGAPRDFITWMNRVQKDGGLTGTVDFMAFKAAPLLSIAPRLYINKDWQSRPITTPKQGFVEKTARQAAFAVEEAAPVPFSIKDIIEGMLNNSEHDYTYKDFLLGIAGSTTIHEGAKSKGGGKVHIPGVSRSRKAMAQ
jgi:hypothetical protein